MVGNGAWVLVFGEVVVAGSRRRLLAVPGWSHSFAARRTVRGTAMLKVPNLLVGFFAAGVVILAIAAVVKLL
jgi:hypothetical protein